MAGGSRDHVPTKGTIMAKVSRVGDLMVYRRLVDMHLRVHELSLTFPKFEMYELGSQMRRSSNSGPANLAEGFNNRHKKIYQECIARSLGGIRETQHHLLVAHRKRYITRKEFDELAGEYNECSRMLRAIDRKLEARD